MPVAIHPTTEWRSPVMLAVHPRVVDIMWAAIAPRLPVVVDEHPLGCHRRRLADRDCFEAILFRLVAGCSWDVAGRLGKGSETTLRRRRTEWLEAGEFDGLVDESLDGYDRKRRVLCLSPRANAPALAIWPSTVNTSPGRLVAGCHSRVWFDGSSRTALNRTHRASRSSGFFPHRR